MIYHDGLFMNTKFVLAVVCLFLFPGCLDSSDAESSNTYDVSVIQEGTATNNLDLIVVLQLDTPGASIAFTDLHIEVGGGIGCTNAKENCDYAEQGDMDGLWEEGEGLEIYETSNWCDSTCSDLYLDIDAYGNTGPSDIEFNPWRIQFQMQ